VSGMNLGEQLALWNHASLRVLDIRRAVLERGESLRGFRLPASAFVFAREGSARVGIDGNVYRADGRCYVCHGGKGALLDISQVGERFEYDMLLYKAAPVLPCREELLRLYRDDNPFQAVYGFAPYDPYPILESFDRMFEHWYRDDPLEKFRVRALFHQLAYEALKQLREEDRSPGTRPDPVGRAVRRIEERYSELVGLEELASGVGLGPRQLQRLFKDRLNVGPMEYLSGVRLDRARAMLSHSDAPLKTISESVGYEDSYYFSRAFKKRFGVSPMHYRTGRRINPSSASRISIGAEVPRPYSKVGDENHYQHTRGGNASMYRNKKSMLAVSVLISLILLLSACAGGSGNNPSASGSSEASPSATQAQSASPSASAARAAQFPVTIKHMKGEIALEQRPEKIAVLDTQFADQLVALNERPAGSVKAAGDDSDFPEYLKDRLSDVKLLGTKDEPNLEAIVAMAPDFIVCTEFQEGIFESLSKIAPTVMLNRNEDWRDTLVTFGKIVGKEAEAEQVLEAYREKTAKLKSELAEKLGEETVALLRPRDNQIRVHTPAHRTGAILYEDLGLGVPEQVKKEQDTAYHISLEALSDVGADHYFLLKDDMFKDLVDEFRQTETWKSLDPVKQDRVYTVDTTLWIAYYGPVAINKVVDQIGEALLGKS